jgi:hypothetical protein
VWEIGKYLTIRSIRTKVGVGLVFQEKKEKKEKKERVKKREKKKNENKGSVKKGKIDEK